VDRIDITLLTDGGCRVVDNGRGIPTDIHPIHKISGVEIALTKLHGGGKFGGDGYKVSGGLHGVGVSVVNALSRKVTIEVDQNGKRYQMDFADGGRTQGKLRVVGEAPRNAGGPPRHDRHVLA
jgi:DNA gyrase subunit B